MRRYLMIASLAMAAPVAAEECKPDMKAADDHFSEAFTAIYRHQGFAWVCAPYIGDDLAESSIVHMEALLKDSGASPNEAAINADRFNAKAKAEAATDTSLRSSNATREEVMIACSQKMDAEYQKFRVARAKMLESQCSR